MKVAKDCIAEEWASQLGRGRQHLAQNKELVGALLCFPTFSNPFWERRSQLTDIFGYFRKGFN